MYFQNSTILYIDYQEKEIILYFCNDNRFSFIKYSVIFKKQSLTNKMDSLYSDAPNKDCPFHYSK